MKVGEKEGKGETDGRVRGFYFFQEEVEKMKKGTQQHNVERLLLQKTSVTGSHLHSEKRKEGKSKIFLSYLPGRTLLGDRSP